MLTKETVMVPKEVYGFNGVRISERAVAIILNVVTDVDQGGVTYRLTVIEPEPNENWWCDLSNEVEVQFVEHLLSIGALKKINHRDEIFAVRGDKANEFLATLDWV